MAPGWERARRAIAAVAALAMTAAGSAMLVRPAAGTPSFAFTRIAGNDRYQTSAALATQAFAAAPTVILATGGNYPDALAASFLAGNIGGPILLTTPDLPLSTATTNALNALQTRGVILVGGFSAISQAEENQLRQTPSSAGGNLNVMRISGDTRYDTMQAIDTTPGTAVGLYQGKRTAFIATGQDFPDALGAAPPAYAGKFPIVLTQGNTLSPQASATLSKLGIQQVFILGGPLAVSVGVEGAINAMGIPTVARFAGTDRSDTARQLAEYLINFLGFSNTKVNLASGDETFGGADALSLGALGGKTNTSTLVTNTAVDAGQAPAFASAHAGTLTSGFAAGGNQSLSDGAVKAVTAGAQGQSTGTTTSTTTGGPTTTVAGGGGGGSSGTACGPTTSGGGSGNSPESGLTSLPNLSSVNLISVTPPGSASASSPAGALLRYSFDKPVTGAAPVPAGFHLVDVTGVRITATGTASVEPSLTSAVDVLYPGITSQAAFSKYTLATISPGAVTSSTLLGNPDGGAAIGNRPALQAGRTFSPDLVGIGAPRTAATTGDVIVDLTFDCSATPTGAGGYHLILTDNTDVVCAGPAAGSATPSGGTGAGGAGTTVMSVDCPQPATGKFVGQPITQSEIARAYDEVGTVKDASSGATNPLQSVTVAPTTAAPDLTSVTVNPAQPTGDLVTFNFDQPVFGGAIDTTKFVLFTQAGAEIMCGGCTAALGASQNQVVVTYPTSTLNGVVGASVRAGAVKSAVGANLTNQPASYGVTGTNQAGVTNTPDLVSAAFGGGGTVVYTFDKPAVGAITAGSFHVYKADGTKFDGTGPTSTSGNTVTVTFPAGASAGVLATVDPGGAGNGGEYGVFV